MDPDTAADAQLEAPPATQGQRAALQVVGGERGGQVQGGLPVQPMTSVSRKGHATGSAGRRKESNFTVFQEKAEEVRSGNIEGALCEGAAGSWTVFAPERIKTKENDGIFVHDSCYSPITPSMTDAHMAMSTTPTNPLMHC